MSFSWTRVGAALRTELRDYRPNRFVIGMMAATPVLFSIPPTIHLIVANTTKGTRVPLFPCRERMAMSAIRIYRPKQEWSVSPATVLPTALLVRLFRFHWNFTVVLDDHPVGKIGNEQVRVFEVQPGEHRLYMRFVRLRKSKELRMSLKEEEERPFVCGTNGWGWPTLREASREDVAEIRRTSISEPPHPGDPISPN